jgi:hypothetical protein
VPEEEIIAITEKSAIAITEKAAVAITEESPIATEIVMPSGEIPTTTKTAGSMTAERM